MNNYHYIIAGLPQITMGADNKGFTYKEVRDEIYNLCSEKDRKVIDWFEAGLNADNLGYHFYKAVLKHPNTFLCEWYNLDLQLRNMKVESFAKNQDGKKASGAIEKYKVGIEGKAEKDPSETALLKKIFDNRNILEKELELDRYKWSKINDFTLYNYFDMNVIIAYLAKASIVERWRILDPVKGKEMFKLLVDEVRGTFKGLNFNA